MALNCPHCGAKMFDPDARRQWSPAEDKQLRELYKTGVKYAVIAHALDRADSSIASRVNRLCLPIRARK
jgi:hypothetical protein